MKRFLAIVTAFVLFSACVQSADAYTGPEMTLRIGHENKEAHPFHLGLLKFKEGVETRTGGKVKVDIYSLTLGTNREMIEQCTFGSLDMVLVVNAVIGNFVPELAIFDLPFLFKDRATAYRVLDGEMGKNVLEKFEDANLVGLGFWDAGYRHIVNGKRDIKVPDDLKGLKIRVMENPVHIATFNALGAAATPMAWSEVFTALQQGTVDGLDNAPISLATDGIYEVQNRMSLTGHFYAPAGLIFSKIIFDGLTPELQNIIRMSEEEARQYERCIHEEMDETAIQTLKDKGMNVINVDIMPFREKCGAIYDDFRKRFGAGTIDALLKATE